MAGLGLGLGLGRGGGKRWSPLLMTGLTSWFDPAVSSSTTTEDAGVQTYTSRGPLTRVLTQATGSARPTYKSAGINGKPALLFTAASSQVLGEAGARNVSDYVSAATSVIIAVLKVTSISTNAASTFSNVGIFPHGGSYHGIYLKSAGPLACAFTWDGGDKHADATTPPLGTAFLATLVLSGGVLSMQIGAAAAVNTACGNIQSVGGAVVLGQGGAFYNGLLGPLITATSTADVARAQAYLTAQYGL